MNILESAHLVYEDATTSRAKATARSYRYAMQLFLAHLQEAGLSPDSPTTQLTTRHFAGYPSYLARQGFSKQTIKVYLSGMRFYYNWLVREACIAPPDYAETLIIQDAMRSINRKQETRLARHPKTGQAEKMVDTAPLLAYDSPIRERDVALAHFLYSSGCRNAEACGLTVGAIDLEERSAVVIGKGNNQHKIFFDQAAADALRAYWQARGWAGLTDPAFARHDRRTGKDHKSISTTTARQIVDDICALAGIQKGKFTPHYFRHAFAITLLRETHDLALVQDLLGHKRADSTRVYAKTDSDELRDRHHQVYQ